MSTDDVVFEKYYNRFMTGYVKETCDTECRIGHVCESQFYSFDNIVYCQEELLFDVWIKRNDSDVEW